MSWISCPAMLVGFVQNRAPLEMFPVVIRISNLVQMTANDGLGFVGLSPDHGVKAFPPGTDIGVTTEEIYAAGTEAEE